MNLSRTLLSIPIFVLLGSACGAPAGLPSNELGSTSSALTSLPRFVEKSVLSGLVDPTAMVTTNDGRIFITEKAGAIRVLKDGALMPTPFAQLTVDTLGERGLLGITLDPAFDWNGYVYVFYTSATPTLHNRVSRLTASGDAMVPGSEKPLLDLETMTAQASLGGSLAIALDGTLRISHGDGTLSTNGQNSTNSFGKMLRINLDGTFPADNPIKIGTAGVKAILARGVRNGSAVAASRMLDRWFFNDPGLKSFDEVNEGKWAANFGYSTVEGPTTLGGFTSPVHAYAKLPSCEISGGTLYEPPGETDYPAQFRGRYFYSTTCGTIRMLDVATKAVTDFATGLDRPKALAVDKEGHLHALSRDGKLTRYEYIVGVPPEITQHPASVTVRWHQAATFTCAAIGTDPLVYHWQLNGVTIPGASSPELTIAGVEENNGAQISCVVTNPFGAASSTAATLVVLPNQPPVATLTAPVSGSTYAAGATFAYAATAQDLEDGELSDSAFQWTIELRPSAGAVPVITQIVGQRAGQYTVPTQGLQPDGTLVFRLRVTDAGGAADEATAELVPSVSQLVLGTSPSGLTLTVDGQAVVTPASYAMVTGTTHTVSAASQLTADAEFAFERWSDGVTEGTRQVVAEEDGASLVASFRAVGTGTGITGEYFNRSDLTQRRVVRVDAGIDFDWGRKSPAKGIAPETFSVRWSGLVQPVYSEEYTFHAEADDGVRLWVNGVLLVDQWKQQPRTTYTAKVTLVAGRKYELKMEYYDRRKSAVARLSWSSASTPQQIVPTSALYPNAGLTASAKR